MTELKTDVVERLQEWVGRVAEQFPQKQRVCVVDDALLTDLRTATAELTTSRATCARLQEEIKASRAQIGDLLAFGQHEAEAARVGKDRQSYDFYQGWTGALDRVLALLSSQEDVVCQHGTAMDVHCCNCHSGFLFDADSCVCEFESRSPDGDGRSDATAPRVTQRRSSQGVERLIAGSEPADSHQIQKAEAQVATLTAAIRRYGKHEVSCDRGKVKEPVKCPSCGEPMRCVRNTSSYLNNYQFDAVKAGDWFCKRHEEFVYVWDSALEKSGCTCGFDANVKAQQRASNRNVQLEAQVATLTAQRDEFKRIGQGFERDYRNTFEQSCKNLQRAETLTAALRRYGQHDKECETKFCQWCGHPAWMHDFAEDCDGVTCIHADQYFTPKETCTCGFAAVLRVASEGA